MTSGAHLGAVATVALPPVGASRTISLGWSRRAANRLAMLASRVEDRVSAWVRLEPRADAWASYAALAFGGVATAALLLA